jgi:hypothetical protein
LITGSFTLLLYFRYRYTTGEETVSKKLYTALTSIQMGVAEDKNGWTVKID